MLQSYFKSHLKFQSALLPSPIGILLAFGSIRGPGLVAPHHELCRQSYYPEMAPLSKCDTNIPITAAAEGPLLQSATELDKIKGMCDNKSVSPETTKEAVKSKSTSKSSTTKSKKRKSDDAPTQADADAVEIPHGKLMDCNCNQVRTRIRTYLASGEMKVGEFQDKLDITSGSYLRFMSQNGPTKGMGSDTFMAAYEFFKKREVAGVKMPRKRTKTSGSGSASAGTTGKGVDKEKWNVDSVKLDSEDDEAVPVYDTCDDVRRKINAHLRQDGITQTGFGREIAKTFPGSGRQITTKQLHDFLSKSGATSGNSSGVFYAAYVFFEKLRIKEGKKKSKKREEMESIHPGGMNRELRRGGFWCDANTRPFEDQYGAVSIQRIR